MTGLERRYRRLLVAYPRWYRSRRGEEMLSTLMDGSVPGQRRPGAVEAGGLVVRGVAMRLDLAEEGVLGELAGRASSPLLAAAAVLSLVALAFGELGPVPHGFPAHRNGPFLTVGWIAYVAWIVAAAADLATASRWQRPAAALAALVTVLAVPAGNASGAARPPLFIVATLVAFGVPALVRPGWTRARPRPGTIATVAGATALLLGATGFAAFQPQSPNGIESFAFYQAWLGEVAAWAPVVAAATMAAVAALAWARCRPSATVLALWVVPWLVLSVGHAARPGTAIVSLALFGALSATLAGRAAHNQWRLRSGSASTG